MIDVCLSSECGHERRRHDPEFGCIHVGRDGDGRDVVCSCRRWKTSDLSFTNLKEGHKRTQRLRGQAQ